MIVGSDERVVGEAFGEMRCLVFPCDGDIILCSDGSRRCRKCGNVYATRSANPTAQVLDEILSERLRQIDEWSLEHDDEHELGELAAAAACYAFQSIDSYADVRIPDEWPWDDAAWKPRNPRRDLIRAAALIVAEIERLDRETG
jgi:hypothetical protein